MKLIFSSKDKHMQTLGTSFISFVYNSAMFLNFEMDNYLQKICFTSTLIIIRCI